MGRTLGSNTASVQKQAIQHFFTIMKITIILLVFLVAFTNAASVNKDDDKYCNGLAKKCKAGDQDACDLYKKKTMINIVMDWLRNANPETKMLVTFIKRSAERMTISIVMDWLRNANP